MERKTELDKFNVYYIERFKNHSSSRYSDEPYERSKNEISENGIAKWLYGACEEKEFPIPLDYTKCKHTD